jgi:hypothetical protein
VHVIQTILHSSANIKGSRTRLIRRMGYVLQMNRERSAPNQTTIPLQKGQIWTFQDQVIEVKHVGKHLAEIIRRKKPLPGELRKPVRVSAQFESIRVIHQLLKTNQAILGPIAATSLTAPKQQAS